MGAALVLCVAVLYVGSGVAIQVLFEELDFEKPFFFSYISVSLCSVHLLQYFYLQGRRSWRRRESSTYRQLEQLDTVEQTQVSILNEPWLLVRPALLLSPAYFGIVIGSWIVKFVVFLVLVFSLRDAPFVEPTVLFITLVAAVVGGLVTDMVAVTRSRVPYVSDVRLPSKDEIPDL